jgi:hypothetical protein
MNATKPGKGKVRYGMSQDLIGSFGFTNIQGTIIEERFFRAKFVSYLLLTFIVS